MSLNVFKSLSPVCTPHARRPWVDTPKRCGRQRSQTASALLRTNSCRASGRLLAAASSLLVARVAFGVVGAGLLGRIGVLKIARLLPPFPRTGGERLVCIVISSIILGFRRTPCRGRGSMRSIEQMPLHFPNRTQIRVRAVFVDRTVSVVV